MTETENNSASLLREVQGKTMLKQHFFNLFDPERCL